MYQQLPLFSTADRDPVLRPTITEQDDVADRPIGEETAQERRPLTFAAVKFDAVG
jgi:hypothetical protein